MSFEAAVVYYLSKCLEGGLFGELFYMPLSKLTITPIPGIYSGLFAIHLACHATKRENDSSKPNFIFYALCVLYALTMVFFAIDIADSVILPSFVSSIFLFYQLRANPVV